MGLHKCTTVRHFSLRQLSFLVFITSIMISSSAWQGDRQLGDKLGRYRHSKSDDWATFFRRLGEMCEREETVIRSYSRCVLAWVEMKTKCTTFRNTINQSVQVVSTRRGETVIWCLGRLSNNWQAWTVHVAFDTDIKRNVNWPGLSIVA